jgi:hypothetical protein
VSKADEIEKPVISFKIYFKRAASPSISEKGDEDEIVDGACVEEGRAGPFLRRIQLLEGEV